jgi:hypothetical protein
MSTRTAGIAAGLIGAAGAGIAWLLSRNRLPRPQDMAQKATHAFKSESPPANDETLTRKVETIIFRDEGVPKGKIVVNTANGVVSLRGEARTPEMIRELESQTRSIEGVKDVENRLHLPKTEPRMSNSSSRL